MILHPEAQALLDNAKASNLKPVEMIPVEEARARLASFLTCPENEKVQLNTVKDYLINSDQIKLRLYQEHEKSPVLIYFHGGGLVLNSIETHDGLCRLLCKNSGYSVISVDYRLAPEYQYPIAITDCNDALNWIVENHQELKVDAFKIVLGGDSSGAQMALATALNTQHLIFGLLLYYPVCDYYSDNGSYTENATGTFLTKKQMVYFWDQFLGKEIPDNSLNIFPIRSNKLDLLPPSYIVTAEYDPLRDEAEALVKKLSKNSKNFFERCPGMMHGYVAQYRHLATGREEISRSCEWLKNL